MLVVSELFAFRNPDNSLANESNTFRIVDLINDIYFVNILNNENYFAKLLVDGDHAFFIKRAKNLNLETTAKNYSNEKLRNHLIQNSYEFFTIGDNHMDDEYAVSYGMNCWQLDGNLVFMR